jgi:hypothetical protein
MKSKIFSAILVILLGVIMVSGCSSTPTDVLLEQSVINYINAKEGITDTSQSQNTMNTTKISENEVLVTATVKGHTWEGTWLYNGKEWEPKADFVKKS